MRAAALLVLAACSGNTGTIALELTTAPGATVLDGVELLRVRLTTPPQTVEAARNASGGFDLALEVEATGETGALYVDGFDDSGSIVATGTSPPFSVASLNARIVVYMAVPMSIAPAPVAFPSPRDRIGATTIPAFGALLAGGRDITSGAALDAVAVYNAYDHTLAAGLALPAPRTDLAVAAGVGSSVFLFGGLDAADQAAGTLWRFDTAISPAGAYSELANQAGFARTSTSLVHIGNDRLLAAGTPVLEVAGGTLSARTDVAAIGARGASSTGADGFPYAVFAGEHGIARYRAGEIVILEPAARPGARVVALPGGTALVVDPAGPLLRVDPATDQVSPIANVTTCAAPTTAATSRHVVIGCDASTFVHDAVTLAPVATIPTGNTALAALPNGQVLLLVAGQPALFTPPAPD